MREYKSRSIHLIQGVLFAGSLKKIKLPHGDHAFVCEGRPGLEAGKRTSSFLLKQGIVPTVICDNMAGHLFYKKLVKEVVMACQYADHTGALCDTGALILAILAQKHHVPVRLTVGERRSRFLGDPRALLSFEGRQTAPKGTKAYVPLVEWVPAKYLK
jgi:methylthioribose-1-phosphate isomerase